MTKFAFHSPKVGNENGAIPIIAERIVFFTGR